MSWPEHGANPHYLYKKLKIDQPDDFIDFSVNINPFGPPTSLTKAWPSLMKTIVDYPDPLGLKLKNKIAQAKGIAAKSILLGNGAAELIQLLAILLSHKKIALFQPTFSEYERMCQAYGASVDYLAIDTLNNPKALKQVTQTHDALFLCHPNNPTGEVYPDETIKRLLAYCEQNNCFLILDEAFYDFVLADISFVQLVEKHEKLIVLQSMTKMYAIAGLRLGLCFAHETVIDRLRQHQAYWSVNGLALKVGELLVDEKDYAKQTARFIANQRTSYFPQIEALGYRLSSSVVNYFLLSDPNLENQEPLLIFLLKKGIIPRHTVNYPYLEGRYLRFSIQENQAMDKLLEALKQWREK